MKKTPKRPSKKKPHWTTREPNRPQAHKRGYNHEWRRRRKIFLDKEENALCRYCLEEGIIEAARIVDHIIPHKGDMDLFWNEDNWQPLCASCHSSDKQKEEKGKKRTKQIGEDGWPM